MRTLSQESKASKQTRSSKPAEPSQALFEQSGQERFILYLQSTIGNNVVQRLLQPEHVQRDVETAEPGEAEYRSFVQDAIRLLSAAAARYEEGPPDILSRLIQEHLAIPVRYGPLITLNIDLQAIAEAVNRARNPLLMLQEISRILQSWQRVYEGSQRIIAENLNRDSDLAEQLRNAYQQAIETLHHSARDQTMTTRVCINLIAAPPGAEADEFIDNATAYARSYYGHPLQAGDEVVTVEGVNGLDELFSAIERASPERMIRRIDIFAHGTIEPTNQIRLGASWYAADAIQAAAEARRFRSSYIQSISRFDENSTMELHACRLGAGVGGQPFLETAGRALGGEHEQNISGYEQRWAPRRYAISWTFPRDPQSYDEPVLDTQEDIYGENALPDRNEQPRDHNPFIARFENHAIQLFDRVVASSREVQTFLTAAERGGQAVTRERKIEIMRAMYDQNQAWIISFQYEAAQPPGQAPTTLVGRPDVTFTRETGDWQSQTLTVSVEQPALVP